MRFFGINQKKAIHFHNISFFLRNILLFYYLAIIINTTICYDIPIAWLADLSSECYICTLSWCVGAHRLFIFPKLLESYPDIYGYMPLTCWLLLLARPIWQWGLFRYRLPYWRLLWFFYPSADNSSDSASSNWYSFSFLLLQNLFMSENFCCLPYIKYNQKGSEFHP